ncbi:hypothetical protein OG394_26780 [Kribbella sp. NBC_01245]|uniref:DoxX family protein n=1 Tax=Kribbella sp. NBC_01245 TaxID=2903578 RepID=UPI002E28D2A9|nr:hypothetical protein [Kribbella sp. NBC_01245]
MTVPVLLIATLLFRVLGALGVRRFATWTVSATHGLAVMLVMTASAHFVPASVTVMPTHADLVAMVPPFVPFASAVIYLTGVLELAGALGLVLGKTRRLAAYCLIALFVLLLPANIYAAVADVPFAGDAPSPLWTRIPEQILFIAVAALAARSRSKSVEPVSRQTLAKV